jgi:hypothetical protein
MASMKCSAACLFFRHFEDCNIHDNTAKTVCSPKWRLTLLSRGWQGGGLLISGTAMLTNTNVYSNQAESVCSLFEPSVTFHPSPR